MGSMLETRLHSSFWNQVLSRYGKQVLSPYGNQVHSRYGSTAWVKRHSPTSLSAGVNR
jgi:hypothetical protein